MMYTFKFYLRVGVLMRGMVKQAVAEACFTLDVNYMLKEEKGFLSSTLFYSGSGKKENVERLLEWTKQFEN